MKPILTLIMIVCCWLQLTAQQQMGERLGNITVTATSNIDLVGEKIDAPITHSEGEFEVIKNLKLRLFQGELEISFTLDPPPNSKTKKYKHVQITPQIKIGGNLWDLTPQDEFQGDWGWMELEKSDKLITWTHLQDKYIDIKDELTLLLQVTLYGDDLLRYDCSLGPPQFGTKQKMPYYIAGAVGLASIGAGIYFKGQSDSNYDEYKLQTELAVAKPIYDKANSQNKTFIVLVGAGAATLAADWILFRFRKSKHNRDKRSYERDCGDDEEPGITLRPDVSLPTLASPNGTVGLSLKVGF